MIRKIFVTLAWLSALGCWWYWFAMNLVGTPDKARLFIIASLLLQPMSAMTSPPEWNRIIPRNEVIQISLMLALMVSFIVLISFVSKKYEYLLNYDLYWAIIGSALLVFSLYGSYKLWINTWVKANKAPSWTP